MTFIEIRPEIKIYVVASEQYEIIAAIFQKLVELKEHCDLPKTIVPVNSKTIMPINFQKQNSSWNPELFSLSLKKILQEQGYKIESNPRYFLICCTQFLEFYPSRFTDLEQQICTITA